jgi:antitoxin VapB
MTGMEAAMNTHMPARKTVQVFRNGRSRAIRIPKEFDFGGDEVDITQTVDGTLIVSPVRSNGGLLDLLATMEPLPEEDWLPEIERLPAEPFTAFDDVKE